VCGWAEWLMLTTGTGIAGPPKWCKPNDDDDDDDEKQDLRLVDRADSWRRVS